MDRVPIWIVFVLAAAIVMAAIEAGYRLGQVVHRRSQNEKEAPVSAIAAATLGLLTFILAFTFAIVSEQYLDRWALVRKEANAVRTAYSRCDFLPQADRAEAKELLKQYVDLRVKFGQSPDFEQLPVALAESDRIQQRLWEMAVDNARTDRRSESASPFIEESAALFIEALSGVDDIHALRVEIGAHVRIPGGIWIALIALVMLGMLGVGYHVAIAGSPRTWAVPILSLSFAVVIALIAELDSPATGYLKISQRPLTDLRTWMAARQHAGPAP